MLSKILKSTLILCLLYQNPSFSKSTTFSEFNSKDLSNYFSGIVAFENKSNSNALKFLNLFPLYYYSIKTLRFLKAQVLMILVLRLYQIIFRA